MDPGVRNVLDRASQLCDDECDDEAELLIVEALKDHPKNLDLRAMLGSIQSRLHRDEEAEITLKGVLEMDPRHEDAACALGRLLDQSLRTDEAEQVFRELLKNSPESHCALDDLCRLLLAEDRPIEALDAARNHAIKFPDRLEAYDGLRYLLAAFEDEICGGYVSESTSVETLEQLLVNMLEQYDTILKIEKNVGPFSEMPESISCDLQNEYLRIAGELEHLSGIIRDRNITLSSLLRNQLSASIQESASRRGRM
ncbi:MAG: hypothetical protein ACXADC_11100 [Candidatus Thorarchaeota archaeon]|jgi:tetratricopeptide (TPR) repeat protein